VTVPTIVPGPFQPYWSFFSVPHFYGPSFKGPFGTSLYETGPLRETLSRLVDLEALADREAWPRLVFTATNLETGQLTPFHSADGNLTVDHVLASGSLPPSFPSTRIGEIDYWDGGVFDNTPLGAVIDLLDGEDRAIMVVNLFPNAMPVPKTMAEVSQRFLNLLFANKTRGDIALMKRFNKVAALMDALEALPDDSPVKALPAFKAMREGRRYRPVPSILEITRERPAEAMESADFSCAGIAARAAEGFEKALAELRRTEFA
jgi:NTE family protein